MSLEPLIGNAKKTKGENCPQAFYVKIRRGTVYSWWTSKGEVETRSLAEDIGSHREAHVVAAQLIHQSKADGTEVEMVTK